MLRPILTLVCSAALVACVEVPGPIAIDDGEGGAGGMTSGGGGATGGGDAGGSDHLPVCGPSQSEPCAHVTDIHAGFYHSCAELDDGTVRCWGANSGGELGSGSTSPFEAPVVGIVESFDQLSLGSRHGCGRRGGELFCWGRNTVGQIGIEGADYAAAPQLVALLGVTDLAANRETSCGVGTNGVYCFGFTQDGQPAGGFDGGFFDSTPTPVPGLAGETVLDVQVGDTSACALLPGDEVRCWGEGQAGRLGTGTWDNHASAVPVAATYPTPVHRLLIGDQHGCVLAGEPAELWCWGYFQGFHWHDVPTKMDQWLQEPIVDVQTKWRNVCALYPSGVMRCIGDNAYGRIPGEGPSVDTLTVIEGVNDIVKIAVGTFHNCALRTDGSVWCWGINLNGQLGRGFISERELPAPVLFNGGPP